MLRSNDADDATDSHDVAADAVESGARAGCCRANGAFPAILLLMQWTLASRN